MKYDFTSIMKRNGRDSIAVDAMGGMPGFTPDAPLEGFDTIPMWVADMNFPTVPTICEELEERIKHPAFGYFMATDSYYRPIIQWHVGRNGCDPDLLTPECIGYENGVLGGVMSAVSSFASPGDGVLLHSPTYIGFTNTLTDNGYKIVLSPLTQDEKGVWRMDYEDMDRLLKAENVHVAIFCSPHNPTGRVWEREEIEKAMEVYRANDCLVISDEIWSDILLNGHRHTPTQSVSEDARNRTVALYAPSKTFNLAGLIGSYHIIYNQYLRDRVRAKSSKCHYNDMNVLSMHALIGAYTPEGGEWVDELCETLSGNINFACDYIAEHFEGVKVSKPEGTYMLFLDCTDWCKAHGKTIEEVEKMCWDVGVALQDGRMFHGPCHLRLNLASPLSRIREAFARMDRWVFNKPEGEVPVPSLPPRVGVGDILPDFSFATPFRAEGKLSDVTGQGGTTLLLFLRYYGCPLCQLDLHELAASYEKIKEAGGRALVVLQSDAKALAGKLSPEDLPYEIICDPEGELYRAFRILPARSMLMLADEATMKKIGAAAEAGYTHGAYEGNELQLPAAFALTSDRVVTACHYGTAAGDVPGMDTLLAWVRREQG